MSIHPIGKALLYKKEGAKPVECTVLFDNENGTCAIRFIGGVPGPIWNAKKTDLSEKPRTNYSTFTPWSKNFVRGMEHMEKSPGYIKARKKLMEI